MKYTFDPSSRRYRLRQIWRTFRDVLRTLNRQAELERLVAWAERKRLSGPRRCYAGWLMECEQRTFRYAVDAPGVVRWARRVKWVSDRLFPEPVYHPRGSAAGYARSKAGQRR